MCPITDKQDPSPQVGTHGSGELDLEIAITKLRGAIMRTVTELDSLCDSVREARLRVEALGHEQSMDTPRPTK